MKNTKQSGVLRFLIYRERSSEEYTGICLELGLMEVSQNPDYLKQSLIDAARGYVHTIAQENLSDDLLNIKSSQEDIDLYERALHSLTINSKPEKAMKTLNDVLIFTQPLNNSSLARVRAF